MKTPRQSHCSGRVSERVYGWSPKGAIAMAGSLQSKDSILLADIISLKPLQCIFMKTHIGVIVIVTIFVIPTLAMGGSFVSSLIQGKSPSEAITILGQQMDSIFGRVSTLEIEQANTNQEIEMLKIENENLRLKTEQVSNQTEQIRTNEDRKSRCSLLASQIDAKENVITQPFEDKIKPLNDELRNLRVIEQQQKVGTGGLSPEEYKELRSKIDSLRKQIDVISIEMEKAVDALRGAPEMRTLINELNIVLKCA